jgi:hypothetical protein
MLQAAMLLLLWFVCRSGDIWSWLWLVLELCVIPCLFRLWWWFYCGSVDEVDDGVGHDDEAGEV